MSASQLALTSELMQAATCSWTLGRLIYLNASMIASGKRGTYREDLDNGTYDIIALGEDASRKSPVAAYLVRASGLLRESGYLFFFITCELQTISIPFPDYHQPIVVRSLQFYGRGVESELCKPCRSQEYKDRMLRGRSPVNHFLDAVFAGLAILRSRAFRGRF